MAMDDQTSRARAFADTATLVVELREILTRSEFRKQSCVLSQWQLKRVIEALAGGASDD
jgi:hypothetical protein